MKPIRVNNSRHMVVTQVCRLSFPQLFTPKAFKDNPREQKVYSCELIFDSKADLTTPWKGVNVQTPSLAQAIQFAKIDQWGSKENWPHFQYPNIKNGSERKNKEGEIYEGYRDKFYVRVKSGEDFPPKIVLADGSQATPEDLYGGCFVQAQILVRPYVGVNNGVTLRLVSLKKVKDGDRFGAGADLLEYENVGSTDNWSEANDDVW